MRKAEKEKIEKTKKIKKHCENLTNLLDQLEVHGTVTQNEFVAKVRLIVKQIGNDC